jgi:hypothetical protein
MQENNVYENDCVLVSVPLKLLNTGSRIWWFYGSTPSTMIKICQQLSKLIWLAIQQYKIVQTLGPFYCSKGEPLTAFDVLLLLASSKQSLVPTSTTCMDRMGHCEPAAIITVMLYYHQTCMGECLPCWVTERSKGLFHGRQVQTARLTSAFCLPSWESKCWHPPENNDELVLSVLPDGEMALNPTCEAAPLVAAVGELDHKLDGEPCWCAAFIVLVPPSSPKCIWHLTTFLFLYGWNPASSCPMACGRFLHLSQWSCNRADAATMG